MLWSNSCSNWTRRSSAVAFTVVAAESAVAFTVVAAADSAVAFTVVAAESAVAFTVEVADSLPGRGCWLVADGLVWKGSGSASAHTACCGLTVADDGAVKSAVVMLGWSVGTTVEAISSLGSVVFVVVIAMSSSVMSTAVVVVVIVVDCRTSSSSASRTSAMGSPEARLASVKRSPEKEEVASSRRLPEVASEKGLSDT